MLRRWTDSIIFLALLGIDLCAWALVSLIGGLDTSAPGRFASISVSSFIVVAAPVLATMMLLAIARSLTWASPRLFYTWSAAAFTLAAVCSEVFGAIGRSQGMDVGLRWMACFCVVGAVSCAMVLVVALTGAIPTTKDEAQKVREAARAARDDARQQATSSAQAPLAPLPADEAPAQESTVPSPSSPSWDAPSGDPSPQESDLPLVHEEEPPSESAVSARN